MRYRQYLGHGDRLNYSQFSVVIPTLNEGKSIKVLISILLRSYPKIHITVVDDGSVDNTKTIVLGFAAKNSRISFIDRHSKGLTKGLTGSMIDGLRASNTKYVIFMDGDLQHPITVVGKIATQLGLGNEIVIATRKEFFNKILYRQIISSLFLKVGNVTLAIQRATKSSDAFSGFFGVKREFAMHQLERNKHRFVPEGYKFLFDLLKSTPKGVVKTSEISYLFRTRKYGSSKASLKQGVALIKSFLS